MLRLRNGTFVLLVQTLAHLQGVALSPRTNLHAATTEPVTGKLKRIVVVKGRPPQQPRDLVHIFASHALSVYIVIFRLQRLKSKKPTVREMAKTIEEIAFKEFYVKLVKVLPMGSMPQFYSRNLLPGDHKDKIDTLATRKEKGEYFLDHVIKPGVEIGYTGQFYEMLRVMENSDDPPVKFLAGEIRKFVNKDPQHSPVASTGK